MELTSSSEASVQCAPSSMGYSISFEMALRQSESHAGEPDGCARACADLRRSGISLRNLWLGSTGFPVISGARNRRPGGLHPVTYPLHNFQVLQTATR